jgi:6-phosphogluconolactonase
VIVANYSGGNIAVSENNDGSIGVQTSGSALWKGSNAKRQEGPHVHMVHFSPDRKFAV